MTASTSTFRPVTPDRPCVICGKDDWCRRSDDRANECHRVSDEVAGFRRMHVTSGGFGIYRQEDQAPGTSPTRTVPRHGTSTPAAPPKRPPPVYRTRDEAIGAAQRAVSRKHGPDVSIGGQWEYQTTAGEVSFVVMRFNLPDAGKEFRPVHPDAGGWHVGDPKGTLPLFGVREISVADRVFVVEGERCVEAARSIGLTATTSAHGSSAPGKTDFTPLAGREVTILPDNDTAGMNYAQSVARILTGLHPPARVKIVTLPSLPDRGDIVDWLAMRECAEPDDLRREITELTAGTPYYGHGENAPVTDSRPEDLGPPWKTIAEIGASPNYRAGLLPIETGFSRLDEALRGGFRPESVYVLAGRTGTAKSTVALNITRLVALAGHSVLLLKIEEPPTEATWRLHSATSRVDLRRLLDGPSTADTDERQRLTDGWKMLRSLPIRLSDCRDLGGIQRIACEHAAQDGKLIVLDQLSGVQVDGCESGYQRATAASNALRQLAVDLRMPIVVVCQVNRAASKSGDSHLSCHDLRDSGEVENDATAVILIDRVRQPENHWRANEPHYELDLIVGKNRYGRKTDPEQPITLKWFPRWNLIEEPGPIGVEA